MTNLVFLHGLESSPQGTKAQLLKKKYPDCLIPHLTPDVAERESTLEKEIKKPSLIVGSSLGGLSALLFAIKHPQLVKGLIVLAPAVGFFDKTILSEAEMNLAKSTIIADNIPCTVIAGERDDVIPLESIRSLIDRSPSQTRIKFIILDDDHSLNAEPDVLLNEVEQMIKLLS